jgi:hypothetical protein
MAQKKLANSFVATAANLGTLKICVGLIPTINRSHLLLTDLPGIHQ